MSRAATDSPRSAPTRWTSRSDRCSTFPRTSSTGPTFSFDTVLITAKSHPLASQEQPSPSRHRTLRPDPAPAPPEHLATWSTWSSSSTECPFQVTLEAGGWEVIKRYVELNLGISIVSGLCITGRENLAVRPLGRYFPKRTYGVVLRRGKVPLARRQALHPHDGAGRLPEERRRSAIGQRRGGVRAREERRLLPRRGFLSALLLG